MRNVWREEFKRARFEIRRALLIRHESSVLRRRVGWICNVLTDVYDDLSDSHLRA